MNPKSHALPVPLRITLASGLILLTLDLWLPYLYAGARYLAEAVTTMAFMLGLILTP